MSFLVNDLSLHGQFHDMSQFHAALGLVMQIRTAVKRFGHTLYCHRSLLSAQLGPSLNMKQAVNALPRAQQRVVLQWLIDTGPFWDDGERLHDTGNWLEHADELVIDTALGEAAWRLMGHGDARQLVSFDPSGFLATPLRVVRRDDAGSVVSTADVANHWTIESAAAAAEEGAVAPDSWATLEAQARARFSRLTITVGAFESLAPHPFHAGAAERVLVILSVLDRLRRCVDERGERTPEGHELYQNFFTGDKAVFSDSSDSEKAQFADALSFRHPSARAERLFCPWHGKVKSPQYRVHFSYPVSSNEPMYVVYVGPKLTKR